MISRQEYAYGIGNEIVHNGEVLKYRGYYNGHIYTTTVDHEAGEFSETVVKVLLMVILLLMVNYMRL